MAKPTFFVIGAMKCGTTVLYENICLHKRIHEVQQKEIHYFSLNMELGEQWYLNHFEGSGDLLTGEASPTYFDATYTQAIPKLIKAFCSDPKLILITRDPVVRAVSHFYHLKNVNKAPMLENKDINDFFGQSFLAAQRQTTAFDFYLHQVLHCSSYSRKLEIYHSVFGADSVLTVRNEDFKNTPQEVMDRVFNYLEVETIKSRKFKQVRYSSGKGVEVLDPEIKKKLEDYLYPDYEKFCRMTGSKMVEY